jgi:fatty acid desaturase
MKIGYRFIFDVMVTYILLLFCYTLAIRFSGYVELIGLSLIHGLLLHRLGLFIHAAAHRDFCKKDKEANDFIYLLTLGWFFGIQIEQYREIHWAHHKNHGTVNLDPEDSYSKGISWKYLFEKFFPRVRRHELTSKNNYLRVITILFHLFAFSAFSWFTQSIPKAIIYYIVPIFFFLPFFTHLRNCLEHSPIGNGSSITRSFKKSPLSFFLGAAGFRLHSEHHDTPHIEYWLLDSKFHQYKYSEILLRLLRN